MRFSTVPATVIMRLAVVAMAALVVLIGVVGWPAGLLGVAALAWYADVRRSPKRF
jgi:hypothetical protein